MIKHPQILIKLDLAIKFKGFNLIHNSNIFQSNQTFHKKIYKMNIPRNKILLSR